jgi:TPP-dependent pyruvate/acetoin dehydrogenase alpha subunit
MFLHHLEKKTVCTCSQHGEEATIIGSAAALAEDDEYVPSFSFSQSIIQ